VSLHYLVKCQCCKLARTIACVELCHWLKYELPKTCIMAAATLWWENRIRFYRFGNLVIDQIVTTNKRVTHQWWRELRWRNDDVLLRRRACGSVTSHGCSRRHWPGTKTGTGAGTEIKLAAPAADEKPEPDFPTATNDRQILDARTKNKMLYAITSH